ncbi:MAG: PEP-CTERM sorting domain-containing protein [Phycisphaerales bacterium]|jgi:hypothetical protein|nr:PEP-CTERM sorting domain-containing protein [Phycisphaerales bacterium]
MKVFNQYVAIATTAVLGSMAVNSAQAYVLYDATPGAVVTMTESPPASGTYVFNEGFTWRDENGGGHTQNDLGSWAAKTYDYRGYQYDGVANTVLLEDATMYIEYRFILPVDDSNVTSITLNTVMNGAGVRARFLDYVNSSWYSLSPVTTGGAGFTSMTNSVPLAAWDNSIPGQVGLDLWIVQEGSGGVNGIDEFTLTATTAVPEPASLGLIGAGLMLLGRRRRLV